MNTIIINNSEVTFWHDHPVGSVHSKNVSTVNLLYAKYDEYQIIDDDVFSDIKFLNINLINNYLIIIKTVEFGELARSRYHACSCPNVGQNVSAAPDDF